MSHANKIGMDRLQFIKQKQASLESVDLSRKGSVDEPIKHLVEFINSTEHYFTTSSCSGRIILFEDAESSIQKKGCTWHFVTHSPCDPHELVELSNQIKSNATFKFEPFVLHCQCETIKDAQLMHAAAVASGFRNSGISIGKKGKIIVAVRSTHSLEVPVCDKGQLLIPDTYIIHISQLANKKMQENIKRIERFYLNFKRDVTKEKETKSSNSNRKRVQDKKDQFQYVHSAGGRKDLSEECDTDCLSELFDSDSSL